MSKKWVYIAGPVSKGNQFHNVADACRVWRQLFYAGLLPICPHWSAVQDMVAGVEYEDYLTYDLEILRGCHAVLRIPGESEGADREVLEANAHGIPVFFDIEDLVRWDWGATSGGPSRVVTQAGLVYEDGKLVAQNEGPDEEILDQSDDAEPGVEYDWLDVSIPNSHAEHDLGDLADFVAEGGWEPCGQSVYVLDGVPHAFFTLRRWV